MHEVFLLPEPRNILPVRVCVHWPAYRSRSGPLLSSRNCSTISLERLIDWMKSGSIWWWARTAWRFIITLEVYRGGCSMIFITLIYTWATSANSGRAPGVTSALKTIMAIAHLRNLQQRFITTGEKICYRINGTKLQAGIVSFTKSCSSSEDKRGGVIGQ